MRLQDTGRGLAARELRRKLLNVQDSNENLAHIAELIEECPGVVSAISRALDERGEILDSASPELADIRRSIRVIHGRIQEKLRNLLSSSQNQYLQEPMVTTRGGRYVVPLMANHKGRIKGIVHDQSNSGATLWIEPLNTVELNNEYRGLQIAEQEEIRRILAELSALVAVHGDAIKRVVERMAELDLIFARARYANATEAVMPQFESWRPPEFPGLISVVVCTSTCRPLSRQISRARTEYLHASGPPRKLSCLAGSIESMLMPTPFTPHWTIFLATWSSMRTPFVPMTTHIPISEA